MMSSASPPNSPSPSTLSPSPTATVIRASPSRIRAVALRLHRMTSFSFGIETSVSSLCLALTSRETPFGRPRSA